MWMLRRASIHLKNRGLSLGTPRIICGKSEIERYCLENNFAGCIIELQEKTFDASTRSFHSFSSFPKTSCDFRSFSSEASAKSSGKEDDDLEDGFSELEAADDVVQEAGSGDENDDGLISESEIFETEDNAEEKKTSRIKGMFAMTKTILNAPATSVHKILDKWVEEGKEVTQAEISSTMLYLRKRRLYLKALQMSEWLESTKHIEFQESYYASRVDLIAKVRSVFNAESYVMQIPESFRGELVYRTLLANWASESNTKKCEELFNKMKKLGFPISCFSCNQLLLLYRRTDKKKIADVLLLMEKENIKPSFFTYQVLIDVKGQYNDIAGMEQIVETMKADGLEPNTRVKISLARHYVNSGLKDKAEAVLKEIEGDDISKKHRVSLLLPIYASLGREDEVERIWKICESNPTLLDCMSAIEAWGHLNKVEKAEEAFDKMMKKMERPASKHFTVMLKVYINNKMLEKGKNLVKRMGESGCRIGPLTWDALVRLYVGAEEVEKADTLLEKASKNKRGRPLFNSYLTVMDQYSKKGDIHNTEKMFLKMRQAGYVSRIRQYQTLLQAYLNANKPVYGFSDRMKADNVFPNKEMAGMLARADAFKKTAISELLD